MAVYGELLLHFPELFKEFSVYTAKVKTVAGLEKRTLLRKVYAVFQYVKASDIQAEGDTAVDIEVPTLWVYNDSLEQFNIVENADGFGIDYRVTKKSAWQDEAGFSVHILESIKGVTDKQVSDTDIIVNPSVYL